APLSRPGLQTHPARRAPSAAALARALERWLKGEPIAARPVGSAGRFLRWCGRNPVIAGLAAALLLVLTTSLAATTGLWLRAAWNAQRAEAALGEAERQKTEAERQRGEAERHLAEEER